MKRDEQIPEFIRALLKEFRTSRSIVNHYAEVETIYLGGGTPSMLSGSQLKKILETIANTLPLAADAEITLEANPGEVDFERLQAYRRAGVNRISFGLQSFDDRRLQSLGRLHRSDQNIPAVSMAREVGFDNVSVDLIFHLPDQTIHDFQSDLRQMIALGVEHISVYSLTVEKNTPLFQYVQDGRVRMTPDELDAEMYILLCKELAAAGYEQYEVSNFCKPGFHSRHNSNYWNGRHYLGYGPSAHSYNGQYRWWNVRDLSKYLNHVNSNDSPVEGKERLDKVTLQYEYLLTRLRTSSGISLGEWNRLFDEDFPGQLKRYFTNLNTTHPKWLRHTDDGWRLTTHGWLFNDSIIQECTDLLAEEEAV